MTAGVFHGKLLLFGEHSILSGSKALILPYNRVSAGLIKNGDITRDPCILESNQSLRALAAYMENHANRVRTPEFIDIRRFRNDVDRGLYCRSTIPRKYGLGSSGAVCAAVYQRYGTQKNDRKLPADIPDIVRVRAELSAMESYFHGHSSGIDPLCIYYDQPLQVIGPDTVLRLNTDNMAKTGIRMFLLDTGRMSSTGELVGSFRHKLDAKGLRRRYNGHYIPLVNRIVEQLVRGNPSFDEILLLSATQLEWFEEWIPGDFHRAWQYGIANKSYACKLCGSGGGGYLLGFTEDLEKTGQVLLSKFGLEVIPVDF